MGSVGACWDNAVVERFFGSLKHGWILTVAQPTRGHMKADVARYMKYYNEHRLHTANNDLSPAMFERTNIKPLNRCVGSARNEQIPHSDSMVTKRSAVARNL